MEEILDYEEKFLSLDSFDPNIDLSFIKREKLKYLFKLINNIRCDAKKYCKNKTHPYTEYLISLFIITFRLIQYEDLNQLYSLKLAELLAKKIELK